MLEIVLQETKTMLLHSEIWHVITSDFQCYKWYYKKTLMMQLGNPSVIIGDFQMIIKCYLNRQMTKCNCV